LLVGNGVAALQEPRPVFFKAIAPFSLPASATPPSLVEPAPSNAPAPSGTASVPAVIGPVAHAMHVAKPPVIDGHLEPLYASASPVSWQSDYAGADSGIATSARFLWMEGALFVLFE